MFRASIVPCLLALIVTGGCANEVEESTEVEHPRPRVNVLASLVADYGGPCWITDGAVSCSRLGVDRTGTESGVKALYGSPCAFSICAQKTDGLFLCWNDLAAVHDAGSSSGYSFGPSAFGAPQTAMIITMPLARSIS